MLVQVQLAATEKAQSKGWAFFVVLAQVLDLKRSVKQKPSWRRVLQRRRPEPDHREAKASVQLAARSAKPARKADIR